MTQTAKTPLAVIDLPRAAGFAVLCAVFLALLAWAPGAGAVETQYFCPPGEGAGQCAPVLVNGVGDFSSTHSLAADSETGHIYVADQQNNRVDVFAEDGSFLFAFGWMVNAEHPEEKLQSCTAASGCLKGKAGTGAGQLNQPSSIAVDNDPASTSHHDLYVAEASNHRIDKFEPTGEFLWTAGKGVDKTEATDLCTKASGHLCGAGAATEAEGGFAGPIFLGVAPGGVLYALDSYRPVNPGPWKHRLQRFEGTGASFAPQQVIYESPSSNTSFGSARGLAVDPSGDLWDLVYAEGIRKYSPGGALLAGPIAPPVFSQQGSTLVENQVLAVDAAGNLYVGQFVVRHPEHVFNVVSLFDSTGALQSRFAYLDSANGTLPIDGLAAYASPQGELLISEQERGVRYASPPPPGPVAIASTVEATNVRAAKATVLAEINPEGKATQVHFDYISQEDWEADGEQFGAAAVSTPDVPLGAEAFELAETEATLGCTEPLTELPEGKCLAAETTYRFRVVATNADGEGEGTVEGQPFTTASAPLFGATYASAVGSDTATLSAEVNPEGLPTTGYFEYVTEAQYEASGFAAASQAPDVAHGQSPLDFGSGEALATRSATLAPLDPATAYRYRIVAQNPLGAPRSGEAKLLRTLSAPASEACPQNEAFRIGAGALLPDCRAYELVSPLDKGGAGIAVLSTTLGSPAVLEQSADSGDGLAYGSARAFGGAPSSSFTSQYIARRIAGQEWRTHPISPPEGRPLVPSLTRWDTEFKFFSPDLCRAWLTTYAEPPLGEGAVAGYSNLYRRNDSACGTESYEALAPLSESLFSNPESFEMEVQGVSGDGAHAIFRATGGTPASGGTPGRRQLYESGPKGLSFVCILPGGAHFLQDCSAGTGGITIDTRGSNVTGAISTDGSRVFWSAAGSGSAPVYVRENPSAPESARVHGAATGTGIVVGPAVGSGLVHKGSAGQGEITAVEGSGFAPHQQIADSAGKIPAGTTILAIEEEASGKLKLTLSAEPSGTKLGDALSGAASATVFEVATESGAFQAGQEISGPGIPPGATVEAVSESEHTLTLSGLATKTAIAAPLEATSPCTEAATRACTVAVSQAAEEAAGTTGSQFQAASTEGEKALFETGEDLYQATIAEEAGRPVVHELLIAHGSQGVLGMSEDGDRVYFHSTEKIAGSGPNSEGDEAVEGSPNLYLWEAGEGGAPSTTFIATLDSIEPVTRITPDGGAIAFTSQASPTGYENKDASTGEAAREVYLYEAGSGKLLCASCDPSGARPVSIASEGTRIAARIPPPENQMHAARVLSDDGARLYFESAGPLSPRDSNGHIDVYQWEAPGTGSCTAASPTYSTQDEGCIDLISSGQAPVDARFVEATPDGSNVFFTTLASLLPQDYGLVDIYDARVNGGLPVPRSAPPSCEGEACQSPPPGPVDQTPASAAFRGAGNAHEAAKARGCPKGKRKARKRKGKARCVKKHAKKHRRHHKRHHRRAAR